MPRLEQQSIRSSCLSTCVLLGIALLFPFKLLGAELSTEPAQPVESAQPEQPEQAEQPAQPVQEPVFLSAIDAPRDYLSNQIISFATDIDRFFGNERNYQESNKSVVQLALGRASGYGGNGNLVLAARANLNLPSTEKRLHLLLESNPDQNVTGEPPQSQQTTPLTNNIDKPQSFGLALRYQKFKEEYKALHLSADAGLKFQGININPFVRARGSYSVPFDQWRMKAEESVYWFNTIGAGETTQIDLEHLLSEPVMFRATSNATWLHEKQNFDLRQDLSIYHTVSDRTALLYQASAIGVSNPQLQLAEYIVSILYRYRLHRNWMFFNVNPQLVFPKTDNFKRNYALNMRLEIMFDENR